MTAQPALPNPLAVLQQRVAGTAQAVSESIQALQSVVQFQLPRQFVARRESQHGGALESAVTTVARLSQLPPSAAEEHLRGKGTDVLLTEATKRERAFDMIGAARVYSLLLCQADSSFIKSPQGIETLCRVSKQLSDMGWQAFALAHGIPAVANAQPRYVTMEDGYRGISDAIELSEAALSLDPANARAHLAVAFNSGRLALFTKNNRQKVQLCNRIKQEAETAISLDPTDDIGWHILGRWHSEMASINPIVKLIVRNVYGGDVGASHVQALENYSHAIALCPRRLTHHAELGKTYLKLGRKQEALEALEAALECEVEDINAQNGKVHAAIIRSELVRVMRVQGRVTARDAAREAKNAAREARREAATSFRSEAQEKRIAKKAEGLARKAEKKRRQEAERERKRLAKLSRRASGSGGSGQAAAESSQQQQQQGQGQGPPVRLDRETLVAALPPHGGPSQAGGGKDSGSMLAAVVCALSTAARSRVGAGCAMER